MVIAAIQILSHPSRLHCHGSTHYNDNIGMQIFGWKFDTSNLHMKIARTRERSPLDFLNK